jgi:1,2-dihydroxy-3-keto-5-methylthiopentene dioxygenase
MVRAWFMDDDVESDQRLEHHRTPPEFVDLAELFKLTGVEYFKVNRKSNISDNLKCFWKNSKSV